MSVFGSRSFLFGSVAAIALLNGSAAFAQTTQLDEVVVEGQGQGQVPATGGEDGSGVGKVKGVVAKTTRVGSKTPTKITEIPQAVSVVGREEIDDQGAQKTDEALRYTAGVFAQPFGSDSDTNWLFIRGFQATDTGVYLDGLQVLSYAFGGFYIDSFELERIEVLKGPASVLYGGSNPGGIVNYISKRADGERHRYIEVGVNDAPNGYVGFDFGDAVSDTASWRAVGRVQGGDGYTDFQDGWRGVISPSITWQRDEQTKLTILGNYTHIDENHNGGSFLPYYGTVVDRVVGGVNYGKLDRDANFTEPDLDFYDREQGSLGYEFEHAFDNGWIVRSNARIAAASIEEQNLYPNGWATDTELARVNFHHDTDVLTILSDQQIEGRFDTGPINHTLLLGFDTKYYDIDQVQSSALFGTTTPIDAFDPVYGVPQPSAPVSYLNQDLSQTGLGVYVQDQLRFADGWLVTLNGRYDHVWKDSHDGPTYYSPTQDVDKDSDDGEFSGRAGIAYEFDNGLTPYASVATFFNPIIGTDTSGAFFVPETGTQYEVGLKYAPTWIDGLFTLSVFDLTRQNVPVTNPASPFTQIQVGEIRSRGVELEAKVNVTDNLKLTGSLTAYDIEITEDPDPTVVGKRPFIVPEVLASASVDYTFDENTMLNGFSVGGGVRYIGSSWADNQNTLKVPSATLVDLKVGYERANWGVDLNVTNLFDNAYVASCQGVNVCSWGEGRSFKLKAHATW